MNTTGIRAENRPEQGVRSWLRFSRGQAGQYLPSIVHFLFIKSSSVHLWKSRHTMWPKLFVPAVQL